MLGDHDRAIAEFEACKFPVNGAAANLPCVYARSGRIAAARAVLAKLKGENECYVSAFDIATIHNALGDREEALVWLEKAVEEQATGACFMKVDPLLADLRVEPRFQALLRRIGAA
jgi:hypothetical protein